MVGWMDGWLGSWLVGWLVGHGQMVTGEMRMIEILAMMGQLGIVGWLVGRLIGWLVNGHG